MRVLFCSINQSGAGPWCTGRGSWSSFGQFAYQLLQLQTIATVMFIKHMLVTCSHLAAADLFTKLMSCTVSQILWNSLSSMCFHHGHWKWLELLGCPVHFTDGQMIISYKLKSVWTALLLWRLARRKTGAIRYSTYTFMSFSESTTPLTSIWLTTFHQNFGSCSFPCIYLFFFLCQFFFMRFCSAKVISRVISDVWLIKMVLLLEDVPSVFWHCSLGGRKGIRHVKMGDGGGGHCLVRMEWRPAGWSVCLPLLILPCIIKYRSSFLAPAHPGGPGKGPWNVKQLWCGVVLLEDEIMAGWLTCYRTVSAVMPIC